MSKPLILVTADVRYIEVYRVQAVLENYLTAATDVAGLNPVIVPSLSDRIELESLLDLASGVLATGARSNVFPELYGKETTERDEPFDHDRDATTLPLIRMAIKRKVPLLAICRGHQELNVAMGGSISSEIQEMDGRFDHRAPIMDDLDERFGLKHPVSVNADGQLAKIVKKETVRVNSIHRQAIDEVADGLQVDALADDGTIEAVSLKDAGSFAIGVQWHPEYWAHSDETSKTIFEAFGDAARAYQQKRQNQPSAHAS